MNRLFLGNDDDVGVRERNRFSVFIGYVHQRRKMFLISWFQKSSKRNDLHAQSFHHLAVFLRSIISETFLAFMGKGFPSPGIGIKEFPSEIDIREYFLAFRIHALHLLCLRKRIHTMEIMDELFKEIHTFVGLKMNAQLPAAFCFYPVPDDDPSSRIQRGERVLQRDLKGPRIEFSLSQIRIGIDLMQDRRENDVVHRFRIGSMLVPTT